ncbi:MAG TPA: metalloregulator ArsR/SmtB family transcription factor [Anaerolineales bacterium]|nr:metalloregulator ArsR/SmtB family transcription factor [Anaerolineales bacterium]
MTVESAKAAPATTLSWDVGTAYELFVSLLVLHEPERYDLRPAWAAKIRSRIPTAERTFLEEVQPFLFLSFPLAWVHALPQPKTAITVLYALQQIPAAKRSVTLLSTEKDVRPESTLLLEIAQRRRWDKSDLGQLIPLICKDANSPDEQALIKYLNWWVRPDDFGTMLYSSLQAYHQAFFEQEELRIGSVLEAGLDHARDLSSRLSIPELITELSQGIRYTEELGRELIVVPTYWMTPLVYLEPIAPDQKIFLFGARPATMSAIPGELVPDRLLIALKALSDPTRLKILNYLSHQELTPSELSRRLNLRAPTVTHHLKELRLAGLINVTIRGQERYYRARLGALDSIHSDLKGFLKGPDHTGKQQ